MKRRSFLCGTLSSALACAPTDPRQISLWFSYGGKNRETLLALVDQFNSSQNEVRVRAVYQGDYFELLAKLRTAMHAGTVPAVTHVVSEVLPYLVKANVLERLDSFAELSGDLDLVHELSLAGSFRGHTQPGLFGIPFNRSTPIAYYNGRILDKLGGAPATTWTELELFATEATSRDLYGHACPIDWWFWVALMGQAGGELLDREGQLTLGGDAGVRGLHFWRRLVERGTMKPPPGRDYNAWQVTNSDFLEGKIACIWTSTAFVRYLEDNAKFQVVAAPLPRDVRHAVPTGGTMFVIPRQAPDSDKLKAAKFLAFMTAPSQASHFASKTGYIPVSKTALATLEQQGFYKSHPNDHVAVKQLQHVVPWPWLPDLFRLQREIVQPRLEAAILSGLAPERVLAEAMLAYQEAP